MPGNALWEKVKEKQTGIQSVGLHGFEVLDPSLRRDDDN
jgi:hypothetical protein